MKIKIVSDAAARHSAALSKGRPPQAGFTREEHMYLAVLRHLQGEEWPEARGIVDGVQCASYLICDLRSIPQYGDYYKFKSKVVAVDQDFIESRFNDSVEHEVPIATHHMQHKLFLERGLQTIEILTTWVDGFCAFLPVEKKT